ncbi:MAG: TIGR03557 family F420-dependent LLM class oxidoreductase [Deltaproteobacteria bacterium]|nr:TIGR03557 family F420-dependent LLM class oxidoreductase [Deltaproteobacteria bacterium]
MLSIGYSLSSEELSPSDLVKYCAMAESTGFTFAMISDHFHPWTHRQGNSPFVWAVLGAVAEATDQIRIGTAVTCPTMRIHPAIVAQAAATVAMLLPDRFMLGLGTGENLNEHIVGGKWPTGGTRLAMLEEALTVICTLWKGQLTNHLGEYFKVENAQIFSRPENSPPILIAAAKKKAAQLAGRRADGLISTAPNKSLVEAFRRTGGEGKPCYGQIAMCWARTEEDGQARARAIWPNALISGEVTTELSLPRHFEEVTGNMGPEMISSVGGISCGPRTEKHIASIRKYAEAGYDHIFIHQIGPDQSDFLKFAQSELLPELAGDMAA